MGFNRHNGEFIEEQERQARTRPVILLSDRLESYERSQRLMFEGLSMHYMECLLSGRLDAWAAAAKAAIDLAVSIPESPSKPNKA